MRNTAKYPVTKAEMLAAVDAAAPSLASDRMGDIKPYALQQVRKLVAALPDDYVPPAGAA